MYKQNLFKVIEPVKINTIKRLNKSKKWKYGYNKEHDVVVISKTGEIGEIYEIQNFKIALPKPLNIHKFSKDKWEVTEYPKELKRIKTIFDWKNYPDDFKKKYKDYKENEFKKRDEGFGILTKVFLLTLLALITCTCSGPRLMLGSQTLEKQIDYSTYSGKLAKQIQDVTECAILKTDVQDFLSWPLEKQLIKPQYHLMLDSVSYQSQGQMLKKCLPTKLYQYP